MINSDKDIQDVDDFNEYATGMLESFLETFTHDKKLLRDIEEDDNVEESWVYVYTDKGSRLVERMISRLTRVGEKYFPNDEIDLHTPYYQEY